jgi:Na+-driven multidrug efflux pump
MFTLMNTILSSILLRAPVSYIFGVTLGWGMRGVGLGAPVASAAALLLIIAYLATGRWKTNAVNQWAIDN